MNNIIIRIVLTTITVLCMVLIFWFSSSPIDESTELSDSLIDNTVVQLVKMFDKKAKTKKFVVK